MSEEYSASSPFFRKKSKGGVHSLLQGKIKPSHVTRFSQVAAGPLQVAPGPPQLEQFCLKYPSLDEKICNQLETQSLMNFSKVSRNIFDLKIKSRFFCVRNLQYQLGSYMGNIRDDWKNVIQKSPIEIVKGLSRTLTKFNQFSNKNKYCIMKCSPLHVAAACGNFKLWQYIIGRNEDKNPKDLYGETPLHWASEKGHLDICDLILNNINDKNPKDNTGRTPLHIAADHGNSTLYQPNENEDDLTSFKLIQNPRDNLIETTKERGEKLGYIEICLLIISKMTMTRIRKNK